MKEPAYKFNCHLLVEPPQLDRFYMDMRVYDVKPKRLDGPDDAGELVWRGIFLAFEVGSEAEHDIGHRLS